MNLIVTSFVCGFCGFFFGGLIGGTALGFLLAAIGFLGPIVYVLDGIYNHIMKSNKIDYSSDLVLESLRKNEILTEEQFENAKIKFNEKREEKLYKELLQQSMAVLNELSGPLNITDVEYNKKVKLLKSMYNNGKR